MKKIFLILMFATLSLASANAQMTVVNLDNASHGQTIAFDTANAVTVLDNGGEGRYTQGDHYLTLTSSCGSYRFFLKLSELDIDCHDTLFIYDGPSTSSPIRAKINNCTGHYEGQEIYVSPTNTSGTLTIRFVCASNASQGGTGFSLSGNCGTPCEKVEPVIETAFYRTRNGQIYDTANIRNVPVYDTTWNINSNGDTLGVSYVDTNFFVGAHLCVGDGVIFRGHGVYSYEHGYYTPSDATTMFVWDMANEGDTLKGMGMTEINYADYQKTGCYDMVLTLTDAYGCKSQTYSSVRVRTSVNPIKTIFTLADICNNTSLAVNMGYSGENATLTLREVESNETVSKINEIRTFLPDGCPPGWYEAPVTFTEFPASKKITRAGDVCSICLNMEHSYIGDVTVSIICPTGQQAFLWYGIRDTDPRDANEPGGAGHGGGGTHLGYAVDNGSSDNGCDTLRNPFGMGLDYCFSRNGDYVLVTGERADAVVGRPIRTGTNNPYITAGNCFTDQYSNVVVGPEPAYFQVGGGQTYTVSGTTKHPSNHADKLDYYIPYTDFSELIGCPLNGTWKIRVHDKFSIDNGWIFNWSMDICGVTQDEDCKYTVGIDSLVWVPNPAPQYHDFDLGHYRGLVVKRETPVVSYISSPDTAGTFPIDVHVYDEFGCVWDTNTRITSYWTPEPRLGNDTAVCGVDHVTLDATDRHTETQNYFYTWSPFGENTPMIDSHDDVHGDIIYVANVENKIMEDGTLQHSCSNRDTIVVSVRKQPLPNFSPVPFSFEGCDPMTITFENQSVDAARHLWVFGDGVTSELESPTHTYAEGTYTLKYYAMSDEGCIDSIISEGGIAVYPKPKASFTWNPVYPSVLNPIVTYNNTTTPQTPSTEYYWQMQYDRDNPLSFQTLTTHNATFDYSQYNENVSGNYNVRLVARTRNHAPSGNVILCADTAANNVLVINDFLQFPNVVTPNGDGINDVFFIQNLVEGLAYPINSLDVYNQWGARVFHRENISSESDFWDPADLPDGTYFYRFSARGYNGNIEHNGAVEVIH